MSKKLTLLYMIPKGSFESHYQGYNTTLEMIHEIICRKNLQLHK